MSATTDAFARFLEVLADSLDDPDTSGDVLASRVHLSRCHFDRLVSSAPGGTPGAPLALPPRPPRLVGRGRAAGNAPAPRAARACGPPARHDPGRGSSDSTRCGVRLA